MESCKDALMTITVITKQLLVRFRVLIMCVIDEDTFPLHCCAYKVNNIMLALLVVHGPSPLAVDSL